MRKIYLNKVSLASAKNKFLSKFNDLRTKTEKMPVDKAVGRVTAKAIYSKRSAPNFYASAMDGIAVKAFDTNGASERNPIELKKEK
ncbi:MAG: molybdopterin biosynthesis protein, partial [Bacillota bacterium]